MINPVRSASPSAPASNSPGATSWTIVAARAHSIAIFGRGMLFAMLSNRIYLGEIVHKRQAHPGEHLPIIDHALWDRVQQLIDADSVERKAATNVAHASEQPGWWLQAEMKRGPILRWHPCLPRRVGCRRGCSRIPI